MKLTNDEILQENINITKQYVKDHGGKVSSLPTATADLVGQIYQYTGTTTSTYTHGYFYECKNNGGTYSWENIPTGGSTDVDAYHSSDTAETSIADNDYIPFYDTSASSKKKSLWSNIKSVLKTYFDGIYITSHQDISGKADKVANATNGNLAGLDANGNITDSGIDPTNLGGGHTILNGSGSAMNQRGKLQFDGLNVTDDSGNDKTVVKSPIFNGTTAEWTALSSAEKAKYTVVNLTDDYGKRLIYEGSFVKGTDTFTDQTSSYYRYVCTKTIGQSNVLIGYDDIRIVPLYISTSGNYCTGCCAFAKYSESKNANNKATVDCFIPGLAYGSFGYVQVEAIIEPNQPVSIFCSVGKDMWATFSQAKIRIYAD